MCVRVYVCALPCLHRGINIYQYFNTREIAQFSHAYMCLFLANHQRMDIRRLSLENTYKLFIRLQIGEYICTSIHTSIHIPISTHILINIYSWAFLGAQMVKNLPAHAGNPGSIPGRSPGGGHGNPLQNFCLEKSMD